MSTLKDFSNVPYENNILGIILNHSWENGELLLNTKATLTKDCFYDSKNQIVYNCIIDMYEQDIPVNVSTISEYIQSNKIDFDDRYIIELSDTPDAFSDALFNHYVKNVLEYYQKRLVYMEITTAQSKEFVDPVEWTNHIINTANDLTEKISRVGKSIPNMAELIDGGLWDKITEPGEAIVKTFSNTLNYNLNGGLHCKRFMIITAPSGHGKTTFAINLIDHLCEQKTLCLYVGLEMSCEELFIKSLSRIAKVNSGHIEGRYFLDESYERRNSVIPMLLEATKYYREKIAPYLTLWEAPGSTTATDIENEVRKIRNKHKDTGKEKTIVVIVDPINGLSTGNSAIDSNSFEKMNQIAGGLKRLARDCNAPVIGISDTTKAAQEKADRGEAIGANGLRGSYELNHRGDIIGEIRTGDRVFERFVMGNKEMDDSVRRKIQEEKVKNKGCEFAVLQLSKQRSGSKIPAMFWYNKPENRFTPIDLKKQSEF